MRTMSVHAHSLESLHSICFVHRNRFSQVYLKVKKFNTIYQTTLKKAKRNVLVSSKYFTANACDRDIGRWQPSAEVDHLLVSLQSKT